MDNDIRLIHGDCLVEMKNIPDKSIDMILCDLPYGTTACKWDAIIPFGDLWEQYVRVLKDDGVIVLFGSEPFSTLLRASNLPMYRYDWVWIKSQGCDFVHAKVRPLKKHETISVFSKQGVGKSAYNPQGLIECHKVKSNSKKFGNNIRDWNHKDTYIQTVTNYPTSILEFGRDKDRFHPTQKPVALLEYLIKTYSNEGETILDNTMGSGSTMVACINTNRKGIGIEKDEKYFEIAKNRVEKALEEKNKPNLFNL